VTVATRLSFPRWHRSARMVQRNLLVYKHGWMVIFSGFFEPVFYLFSIGLGLGALIADVEGMSYAAFVAPGLLAASCLNGAITDGCFNIFFKLHFQKTYDGILATPMRVADVAFGETLWAVARGAIYAAGFLIVMFVLGVVTGRHVLLSPLALLAFPAAVLSAAAFSSIGVCITTFIRRVEDFDFVIGLGVTPMFLFSGTFFPLSRIPAPVRQLVELLPLYHAVALLRALTTGLVTGGLLAHLVYLVVVGVGAFMLAVWRLERALVK